MRHKIIPAIFFALALSACERMTAIITPLPERISQAFPPANEIQNAYNALNEDSEQATQLHAKFKALLEQHALKCSHNSEIGRFDNVSEIRTRIKDKGCFKERDKILLDWLGRQHIALILNQPPISAPPASHTTTPLLLPQGTTIINTLSRSGSDILALQTYAGWLTARHSDGKLLHELENTSGMLPEWLPSRPSLSPNGRLLAIQRTDYNQPPELVVIETTSGKQIWRSNREIAILNWWPELPALTTLTRTKEGLKTTLFDLQDEQHVLYQWQGGAPAMSTEIAPAQLLLGGEHTLFLFKHWRAQNELRPNPTGSWQLKQNLNNQNTAAAFDNSRKLFYLSHTKLAWIDLESGKQGAIDLRPIFAKPVEFLKVNDTHILLLLKIKPEQNARQWVFNTKTATLAKVLPANDPATASVLPLQTPIVKQQVHNKKIQLVLQNALHIGKPVAINSILAQNAPQSEQP